MAFDPTRSIVRGGPRVPYQPLAAAWEEKKILISHQHVIRTDDFMEISPLRLLIFDLKKKKISYKLKKKKNVLIFRLKILFMTPIFEIDRN